MPLSKSTHVRIWLVVCLCTLIICLLPLAKAGVTNANLPGNPHVMEDRGPHPTYSVVAGIDGEIFPVFANYFAFQKQAERQSGTITVTVRNSSNSFLRNRVAVRVPGWSDEEIQYVELGAGEVRNLQFAPTFLQRLFRNRQIVAATVVVSVSDNGGRHVWSTTVPVRLRSADDMYWGKDFHYANFIASWITPHDPNVEMILRRAKEFMPGRRLPGYETWRTNGVQEKTTYLQAKAIYQALQREGLSYVKSSSTMGSHINSDVTERVRLPGESLRQLSANCIDGVVLYASLFENLGMEPEVILIPGHAYVAVRLAPDSNRYLYVETAVTGRAPFEAAVSSAVRGVAKHPDSEIIRIPVAQAREIGIYPLPHPVFNGTQSDPVQSADVGTH